jgi:RNase P/RNase MRP subunit p29
MSVLRAVLLSTLLTSTLALAAPKAYQVTGEVVELTDDVVTVLKGKEKFEIARDEVKPEGELKKGSKVTVEYKMTATTITVKEDKKKK